jgi:hypothetical protein
MRQKADMTMRKIDSMVYTSHIIEDTNIFKSFFILKYIKIIFYLKILKKYYFKVKK